MQRYSCYGPIEFRTPWYTFTGRILNLCLDGCLIESSRPTGYIVGDHLELRFKVNRLSFRVQCIVRHLSPDGTLGVEVLLLSDRSRKQLNELIEELASSPARSIRAHGKLKAARTRPMTALIFRLRKHADYQRVYKASRKQFARQMTYFFTLRPQLGPDGTPLRNAGLTSPRIGLTVGKVMGKAVDRNRIKRRMREAVRKNLPALTTPVDVILHPRRTVLDLDFTVLDREVANVFRTIQKAAEKQQDKQPELRSE